MKKLTKENIKVINAITNEYYDDLFDYSVENDLDFDEVIDIANKKLIKVGLK